MEFLEVFRKRRVHLVPPILDLGFLYPKLSKVFYWQYFLKNLKIRCCRSCYIQDQLLIVIWNHWAQSQMYGCLCGANPREKESVDSELACSRVSKLLLEVTINLGLNLIAKTSILYSGFVLPWEWLGQIIPRFLPRNCLFHWFSWVIIFLCSLFSAVVHDMIYPCLT